MADPARIDLILLATTTRAADVERVVGRAVRERCGAVVVPPAFARLAVQSARGTGVEVASVVGHPSGLAKPTIKSIEATSLAKDDVAGLEVTPLAANVVAGDLDAVRQELLEVARGARAARPEMFLAAYVDLDWPGLDRAILPRLATTIVQSACDGIVLASTDVNVLLAALTSLRESPLRKKAVAPDPADTDRLLTAGADRVGVSTPP